MVIELPPIEAYLLGLVDRANQQSNPDGEQLDFSEGHLDVARHDQPLVEYPIQHFDQTGSAPVTLVAQLRRHRFAILWDFRTRVMFDSPSQRDLGGRSNCSARTVCP